MKFQLAVCAAIAATCFATSAIASDGDIGVFFDADKALCKGEIPCLGQGRLYVCAILQGASINGITGAEFGLEVSSNTLFTNYFISPEVMAPGAAGIGLLFTANSGINIVWPTCQTGNGTSVLLEYVDLFNFGCSSTEIVFTITKRNTPYNQYFQCPLFTLCDAPFYTKVCLGNDLHGCPNPEYPLQTIDATCSTSLKSYLNPGTTRTCTVSVESKTWSGMKSLYR